MKTTMNKAGVLRPPYKRRVCKYCLAIFFTVSMLASLWDPARAACRDDVLNGLNGGTLVMRSGTAYRILNHPDTATIWLPLSRLTICAQVVNVRGEMTTIYEIRNKDGNDVLVAVRER